MAITTMQYIDWLQTVADAEKSPSGKPSDIPNGYSPGGVAAKLGISRQAVHQAIRDNRLDATCISLPGVGGRSEANYWFVSEAALNAFKKLRENSA